MSNQIFTNGLVLQSSALTPEQIATIFQAITCQILGLDVTKNPPKGAQVAYAAVRVGWQQTGQPFSKITEDVCYIMAYPENDAYSRTRDQLFNYNDNVSVNQQMSYTQVWRIHHTFYGPNAYDHARLLVSSMSLDWVHDFLKNPPPMSNTQIYMLADWERPKYVPELFQGQWWQRADVDMKCNELVREQIVVPTAIEETVTIIPDVGQPETVIINA